MHLHQQFLSENHDGLIQDYEVTVIDKSGSADPTRRESFWMRKLETLSPLGSNLRESV